MKAGKPADTSDDTTVADAPIQLPDLSEQLPLPEIKFSMQQPTPSKDDQITSIPAPLIDCPPIPPIPHSTSWLVAISTLLSAY